MPTSDVPAGLTIVDWDKIRSEHERHRYSASPVAGGFRLANPSQEWIAMFDGRGFNVTPNEDGWNWGLELTSFGFAGQMNAIAGGARISTQYNRLTYGWGNLLHEWYCNDPQGLEHGFTLFRRPLGEGDTLELRLARRGGLRAQIDEGGLSARFMDASGRVVIRYGGLAALDADGRRLNTRMSEVEGGLRIQVDQNGARYPLTIDPIIQKAQLKSSNARINDSFGWAVAMSGDTAVVGAPAESSGFVFVRNGTGWVQQARLTATNEAVGDAFGTSVAISGDTVVVGAPRSGDLGAAYVFVKVGTEWTQQAQLKPSIPGAGDAFGMSVAIFGDTIVAGAPRSANSGAAYVFERDGAKWRESAQLNASNPGRGDAFGISVGVSEDTIVVGAPRNGNAGAAFVFVRSGGAWIQQAHLRISNPGAGDALGMAVAISGGTVLAGAPRRGGPGGAFVFVRDGLEWSQQARLEDPSQSTSFGESVAISGDLAVVGSPGEHGAANVFARTGTGWIPQARLEAANARVGAHFGHSVAVYGGTVVAGSSGTNEAGDAYLFASDTVSITITSEPAGMLFSSTGSGCAPGSGYTTPATLSWTASSSCSVTFALSQLDAAGTAYTFNHWEDSSTDGRRMIAAPDSGGTYTAAFLPRQITARKSAMNASTPTLTLPTPASLPGLNPGDSYQFVFVTSGTTVAASTSLSTYNNFVQSAATAAGIGTSIGVTWKAMVSTGASPSRAKDNAPVAPTTKVYLLNGTMVADGGAIPFYAGENLNHLAAINYTELGTTVTGFVWTGGNSDGSESGSGLVGLSFPVYGNSAGTIGSRGDPNAWARINNANAFTSMRLYAVSSVFGPPSSPKLTANSGVTPQSTKILTAFPNALAVTATDASDKPVSGLSVTFTAPTGSGVASGTFGNNTNTITVNTSAAGIASVPFTANSKAGGPYNVAVSATNYPSVNLALTNTVGSASLMSANAGTTPQSAKTSTAFSTPTAVTVTDAGGNPVSGVSVTFSAPASGPSGTFLNGTVTTQATTASNGIAAATVFTANSTPGGYQVAATSGGLSAVNFALSNAADISGNVTVTQNGFARNRSTGYWVSTLTVANIGKGAVAGPIQVVLKDLVNGTMVNNNGMLGGNPYITVITTGTLAPGAVLSIPIQFINPSNGFISFTPVTYIGGL